MTLFVNKFVAVGLFLLLLLPNNLNAQDKLDYQPKTQLLLHTSLNLNNKLAINTNGTNLLNSKNAIGFNIGFGVSQLLFDNFSIIIGGDYTLIGTSMNYNFLAGVQRNQRTEEVLFRLSQKASQNYTSWRLGFSYYLSEKILNDKFNPIVTVGFKRNSMISYFSALGTGLSVSGDEPLNIFHSELSKVSGVNYENFNFISYYLKLGLLKKQTKFNTMQFNFVYHYSPDNIGEGTFLFSNIDRESSGTLELGVNYLGVEFNYGFTFFKTKRLKIKG